MAQYPFYRVAQRVWRIERPVDIVDFGRVSPDLVVLSIPIEVTCEHVYQSMTNHLQYGERKCGSPSLP